MQLIQLKKKTFIIIKLLVNRIRLFIFLLCAKKYFLLQKSPKGMFTPQNSDATRVFDARVQHINMYIYTEKYIYITSSAARVFIV